MTETRAPEIGDLATMCYPNDRYPLTIIAMSESKKHLTVQQRKTGKNQKEWPEQEFETYEDPNGSTYVYSLRRSGRYVRQGSDNYPWLRIGSAEYYQAPEI